MSRAEKKFFDVSKRRLPKKNYKFYSRFARKKITLRKNKKLKKFDVERQSETQKPTRY